MITIDDLTIYHHNGICLILEHRQVEVLGRQVHLPRIQFSIFHLFMKSPEVWRSRDSIIDWIEGDCVQGEYIGHDRSIDAHIKRMRKQLFPNNPILARNVIETCYKRGYRIANLRKGRL